MITRSTSFLGLAFADRAITCAEAVVSGDRRNVRRLATFVIPDNLSLAEPVALGQALAAFLRSKRFAGSRAVIGLPARWLIAIEKEIPPSSEIEANAALRLQAERLASAESGELLFDYAGRASASAPARVLLVGTLRQRLAQITKAIEAAGMSIAGITSTGLALAASAPRDGDGTLLVLSRGGGEIIRREAGNARALRHIALSSNGHTAATLASELRRALALSAGGEKDVLLLNGIGLADEQLRQVIEPLGITPRPGGAGALLSLAAPLPQSETASDDPPSTDQYVPAAALALAGAQRNLLAVDFHRSRLAPPAASRLNRTTTWGIIAGVILLAAIIVPWVLVHQRQSELDEVKAQRDKIKEAVASAQSIVERATLARGFFEPGAPWQGTRPAVLEGLRQVTLAFRDNEAIWVSSFTLHDNGKGQIAGKSADQKLVLALLDRLKGNSRLADVKLLDMRDADTRTREIAFSISFVFNNVERP